MKRRSMKKNITTPSKWYHFKSKNLEYYSPSVSSGIKTKYYVHGSGKRAPRPIETKELIEDIKKNEKNLISEPQAHSDGVLEAGIVDSAKEVDLPPGTYQYMDSDYTLPDRLVPIAFRQDGFVKFGDTYDAVLEDIKIFLKKEDVYRKLKVMYKRGILLYGPPGQGKTALLRAVVHSELPKDAVTIIFDKSIPDATFLNLMKDTLEHRIKLFIFEELVDFVKRDIMEDLLTFLDGEFSIDKSLIIATTNYPEKLPGNLVDRPSRFDRLYKVGHPNKEQRRLILKHYLQRDPSDTEVDSTEKLSTAAIKEAVLVSMLREISMVEAVAVMKKHSDIVKKNFEEDKERIGL